MTIKVTPVTLLLHRLIVIWAGLSTVDAVDLLKKSQAATWYEPCNVRLLFICLTASCGPWDNGAALLFRYNTINNMSFPMDQKGSQRWDKKKILERRRKQNENKCNRTKKNVGQESYKLGSYSHYTSLVNIKLAAGINISVLPAKGADKEAVCQSLI